MPIRLRLHLLGYRQIRMRWPLRSSSSCIPAGFLRKRVFVIASRTLRRRIALDRVVLPAEPGRMPNRPVWPIGYLAAPSPGIDEDAPARAHRIRQAQTTTPPHLTICSSRPVGNARDVTTVSAVQVWTIAEKVTASQRLRRARMFWGSRLDLQICVGRARRSMRSV